MDCRRLPTDTPADSVLAYNFGQTAGVSASLGVTFTEISSFIDDPTAFVEGIGAMVELVEEEEAGALETLVEVYAKQLERKQDQNNPYEVNTTEHDSFKTGWYTGYSAGFLVKEILGSKGAGAAKSTLTRVNRVENAVSRLRRTGAITALSRANSAVDAAKAQAVARIVTKASDDAAEPLVSQADTAGQAYRLWRLQKQMDADVSDLPESQQATLGNTLIRSRPDSRQAIRRMDDSTLEEYTDLDVDSRTRASFAQRYADLDADGRDAVRKFIDQTEEFDPRTRDALRRGYARGDIDLQTGDTNNIVEEIQTYRGFERVTDVEQTGHGTTVRGVVSGEDGGDIDVTGRFINDGDDYVDRRLQQNTDEVEAIFRRNDEGDLYDEHGTDAIRHLDEASEGDAPKIRGQLGEEVLQPDLARSKYGSGGFEFDGDSGSLSRGYIPEKDVPFDLDASQQGFDGFAIDSDGNLVIVETKVTNTNGRVTRTNAFGETLDAGERQMSDKWIQDRLRTLTENADSEQEKAFIRRLADDDGPNAIDISERGGEIQIQDVNHDSIRKELFTYQDGEPTGELASSGLRVSDDVEPTLDRVEVVKIGDIFQVLN